MSNDEPRSPRLPSFGYTSLPKLSNPTPQQTLDTILTATNHLYYALSLVHTLLSDGLDLDTTVDRMIDEGLVEVDLTIPNPKPQPTTPQEPTL